MKIERSCETGLYKNIWTTQNYVSEVLFCSSSKDMLLNSTFPMLSFNALMGNFSPPFLFLSSFCITGSWWLNYVVTTIDGEYQFKLRIGDGGVGGEGFKISASQQNRERQKLGLASPLQCCCNSPCVTSISSYTKLHFNLPLCLPTSSSILLFLPPPPPPPPPHRPPSPYRISY